MYVLFTMWSKLWIDIFVLMMFLRKEDFPCPFFFCLQRRETGTWETSLHDAWTLRRVARTASFRPWSCRCHARGLENMFHPFFRSHRRERLAQLKFGELLRGRLREWQRCERAVCHAIQSFFLERTMTNKGRLCCDRELNCKKLQSVRQRRDKPQGLEPLQDGW